MAEVAIYEPDPRICGPDTWAQHLKSGFTELGHRCDLVAFTRAARWNPAWGRVDRAKSSSGSCSLVPDRVEKVADAGDVLDEYDLIILTDVKTATRDNEALKDPMVDEPIYLTILRSTRTKWTSALHGRWYFARPDPIPPGVNETSGSPFLHDLLALPNFSGFLVSHAKDFDKYSSALRKVRKEYLPLPYKLTCSDEMAVASRSDMMTMAVIGRMIPTKHRHVVNEMLTRGALRRPAVAYYGGACVCTHGPSETYLLNEGLVEAGWQSDWGNCGVRRTKPFVATLEERRARVEYLGAYEHPHEVLRHAKCHVGITDCDFSGGLLEFATLEAIDCGCVPIVTAPFVPHVGTRAELTVIEREFRKFSPRMARGAPDELYEHIATRVVEANARWSPELVLHNRASIAHESDPRRHASAFLENCL